MSSTKNTLKLSAVGLSLAILAGCSSSGADTQSGVDQARAEAAEARSMASEALNAANQAQRTAQQALQQSQSNKEEMDRMFERSMRK